MTSSLFFKTVLGTTLALTPLAASGQSVFMSPSMMKSDSVHAFFRHPQNGFVESGSTYTPVSNQVVFHYERDRDANQHDYTIIKVTDLNHDGHYTPDEIVSGMLTVGHCWIKDDCPNPTDVIQFVNNKHDAVRNDEMQAYGWHREYTNRYVDKKTLSDITTAEQAQERVLKTVFEPQ